jgi:hypothetical protein
MSERNHCRLADAPRPARRPRKQRSAFAPEQLPPLDLCDGCGRQVFTTVCNMCLGCAQGVLMHRRAMFPASEGNVYMRRRLGRAFRNYFRTSRKEES